MRLRDLPIPARLGIMCLLVVMAGGLWASIAHLEDHHQSRDSKPGVSLNDLKGAYHGVRLAPPLETALDRNHPPGLPPALQASLRKWLSSKSPNAIYDEPALGAEAPSEILAQHCIACHGRKSTDVSKIGEKLPLEYWDDVKKTLFETVIEPVPTPILVSSSHAHLLAMATLSLGMLALLWGTRYGSAFRGWLTFTLCFGLLADFAAQWLARGSVEYVYVMIAGGGIYMAAGAMILVLTAIDLWRPNR